MSAPAVSSVTELRCHHCSHAISPYGWPVRIVAVYRNYPGVTVVTVNPNIFTRRCRDCGWINAFEPS